MSRGMSRVSSVMSNAMSRAVPFATLFALSLASPSAEAQDDAPPRGSVALSETDAVRRALEQDPTLHAAAIEARRAQLLVESEEARYQLVLRLDGTVNLGSTPSLTVGNVIYPYSESVNLGAELERAFPWGMVVTLGVDATRTFRRADVIPTMPTVVAIGPGYGLDVTLEVVQPLLRGFGDEVGEAELRNARADHARADLSHERAASDLMRDVLLAYWELFQAEGALEVERQARELAARRHEEARIRVELGALETADALALATSLATAEESLSTARAAVSERALELGRLTGVGYAAMDGAPAPPLSTSSDAVALAFAHSPELAVLEAEVETARVAARTAAEALRPRLDLSASLGVHGLGYDDLGQTFGTLGTFTAVTGMVSLTYETPLEDTRLHRTEERAALAVDAAEERVRAARARIEAEVRRALSSEESAARRLELAEETVTIATQLFEAEEGRRELGSTTTLSVLDAEEQLRRAQLRAVRARTDLARARITTRALTGELLSTYPIE
jgi:outer membrane protein TolC